MGGKIKGRNNDHAHVAERPTSTTSALWESVRDRYSADVCRVVDAMITRGGGMSFEELLALVLADFLATDELVAEIKDEPQSTSAVARIMAGRTQSAKVMKAIVAEMNPQSTPNTKRHPQTRAMAERRADRRKPDPTDTGDELVN